MKKSRWLILMVAALLGSLAHGSTRSEPVDLQEVIRVQFKYKGVILKLRGVDYMTTTTCEEATGRLALSESPPPYMDCIATHVKTAEELRAIEEVYPNPMLVEGVLIHFTLEDPIPNKGGITVHN